MTLKEIESMEKEYLIPREVAAVLGCNPYSVNVMAQQCREKLGFPVIVMGSRVRIPRIAFIKYMRGELGETEQKR